MKRKLNIALVVKRKLKLPEMDLTGVEPVSEITIHICIYILFYYFTTSNRKLEFTSQ